MVPNEEFERQHQTDRIEKENNLVDDTKEEIDTKEERRAEGVIEHKEEENKGEEDLIEETAVEKEEEVMVRKEEDILLDNTLGKEDCSEPRKD